MPYIKETCVAGKTIEITKYYSVRYHSQTTSREEKNKKTSEAQQKVNQRKAVKELRRLMNSNFQDGDLLVRLDFNKYPDIEADEMQKMTSKAIRKLRAEFAKVQKPIKYIYVKEIGPRGGRHLHMVLSQCSSEVIRKCWPYGGIHIDPLISNGQYSKIAEYFIKYADKTEKTAGQLVGKRWYASRNLTKPKITKKVITAKQFKKEAREKKGYYIDKDSIREGISEITGFEFFSYTLIRTDKKGGGG